MIYDITQEYFSGRVYPGDPKPTYRRIKAFEQGDQSTVTEVTMQVHAATHMDAPIHRVAGGKGIDEIPLSKCIGACAVIDGCDLQSIRDCNLPRILFKNCQMIDVPAAELLRDKGVLLVGAEGESIGDRTVHRILLENEIAVLEGAKLSDVPAGEYFLFAAPVPFGGCDGAPVRAVLVAK